MLTEPTADKLKALRLHAMTDAWFAQQQDVHTHDLDFDTRLGLLVDAEWLARENRRMTKILQEAKLRISTACIENIEFSAKRQLDKRLLVELCTARFIDQHQNVIITGPTGVGKTYVACAIAHSAARKGKRVLYRRVPRLFEEFALAHADGSYTKLLARFARFDLLVLDDWGITALDDSNRRDILEIFEDRHALRSTILTSQLPSSKWHDFLADPTIADAVCDRVLHNAHKLQLAGPSRRKDIAQTTSA